MIYLAKYGKIDIWDLNYNMQVGGIDKSVGIRFAQHIGRLLRKV